MLKWHEGPFTLPLSDVCILNAMKRVNTFLLTFSFAFNCLPLEELLSAFPLMFVQSISIITYNRVFSKIGDSGNVDNKDLCREEQNKFSKKKYLQWD